MTFEPASERQQWKLFLTLKESPEWKINHELSAIQNKRPLSKSEASRLIDHAINERYSAIHQFINNRQGGSHADSQGSKSQI